MHVSSVSASLRHGISTVNSSDGVSTVIVQAHRFDPTPKQAPVRASPGAWRAPQSHGVQLRAAGVSQGQRRDSHRIT
jgi:hypothetical protein